ncbi:hypothetical protein K4K59_009286 [Colletotrichum sp. SAR11_240]|nr:hypothetical protein K4K59_009286 [Colletotrichum sp. SAR11_240]
MAFHCCSRYTSDRLSAEYRARTSNAGKSNSKLLAASASPTRLKCATTRQKGRAAFRKLAPALEAYLVDLALAQDTFGLMPTQPQLRELAQPVPATQGGTRPPGIWMDSLSPSLKTLRGKASNAL